MPSKSPESADRDRRRIAHFRSRIAEAHPEVKRRGWAASISDRLGIHASVISRLLGGDRPVPTEHMIAIAKELNDPELVPPDLRADAPGIGDGHGPAARPSRPSTERMSPSPAKLPPSLESYLAHHTKLHPAVRHHLQLNHDLRTEGWVERDEAFWADLAVYFAKRLRVPLEEEGGAQGTGAPRKGKG
jgi:hypothetical protein